MSKALSIIDNENAQVTSKVESVLIDGDLQSLSKEERLSYYKSVCDSVGLNWLTKPFDYIRLNGKLVLYANRSCSDQLRKNNNISVKIAERQEVNGLYIVKAEASDPSGRKDESIGALSVSGLKGEQLANAIMKCETKAKRRVTLSICGLGMLDETEIDSVSSSRNSTKANIDNVVRPQIEESKERTDLIECLESVVRDNGIDSLADEWKNKLTKEQRALIGGEELSRIKALGREENA